MLYFNVRLFSFSVKLKKGHNILLSNSSNPGISGWSGFFKLCLKVGQFFIVLIFFLRYPGPLSPAAIER